jgi:hypothetical protein
VVVVAPGTPRQRPAAGRSLPAAEPGPRPAGPALTARPPAGPVSWTRIPAGTPAGRGPEW